MKKTTKVGVKADNGMRDEESFPSGLTYIKSTIKHMVLLNIPSLSYASFLGFGRIACLHGAIQINGFTISPLNSSIDKTYEFGCIKNSDLPISVINDNDPNTFFSAKVNPELNKRLNDLFDLNHFMANHQRGDSIILLTNEKTKMVEFTKAFYPQILSNLGNSLKGTLLFPDLFLLDTRLFKEIPSLYNDKQLKEFERIFSASSNTAKTNVCLRLMSLGGKSSGKSTFNRYIANRLLSKGNKNIFWLDLDIGQPEFTVPCVLSLSKIDEPILTPPALHVRLSTLKTYFFGKFAMDLGQERYTTIVSQLMRVYVNEYAVHCHNPILIVNTMGFVINQGKDLHDNLIPIIQPVFFVSCKGLESNFSYRKPETFSGSTDINVERNTILTPLSGRIKGARDRSINSGKDARHMRICGYFSYIMEIFARQIFNYRNPSLWPYYEIDMNKYAIYLDEHLPILQEETLQLALNVTLVAFCTYVSDPEGFDKSGFTELNFDNLSFPKRLSYNYKGFNQRFSYSKTNIVVVGYGIITNVDIKNYKFHVATPLTQKQLQEEVKIIARGVNFTMPPEFIKFQGDYNDDNYKVLATSDQNWFIWNSDFKRRVTDTKKKHV